MNFIQLIIGFILLIICADLFVDGCSKIASVLGVSALIVGLTIVALGTSAPEAAISITASIKGMNDISLGNVVGSNICNLLLVLGLGGLGKGVIAKKKIIDRDFKFLLFSGLILLIITFTTAQSSESIITRSNGLMLICFLGLYLYTLTKEALHSFKKSKKTNFNPKYLFLILIGLIGIIAGGELVVDSATNIANILNISQNVIALTIIAIGTSLPEIVTTITAVKKGESEIAIGNIVGSNIFNIFFVLGISSAISPVSFGYNSFIDVIIMLIASIIVYLMFLKNKRITKQNAFILLALYIVYTLYILIR